MTDDQEQLILRFLNKTISPEEKTVLLNWIHESEANKKLMDDFTLLWNESKDHFTTQDFETSAEWEKFSTAISSNNVNKSKDLPAIALSYALRIAASICFIALFSWILYLVVFSQKTILKESGETIVTVLLPDGSEILLNRHSKLAYDNNYNNKERIVKLSGEAFFDVKKIVHKPFVIQTSEAQVKVMGTSFNVQAYDHRRATEVYVASGVVNFASIKNKSAGITLNAGDAAILTDNSDTVVPTALNNSNALAWKDKKLVFNKKTIEGVVEDLERYFGIDINIKNQSILRCRFTGSFTAPTLSEIVEALSTSLDLTISKADAVYVIDGPGC